MFGFRFLLDQTKKGVASPLEFLRTPTLEEPVETEDGEFGNILLYPLVNVIGPHTIVVESTEKITVLLFRVDFALGRRIVELQFLHGIPYGSDLLGQKCFEIRTLCSFRLTFLDTCLDTGIFSEFLPLLFEDGVVSCDLVDRLVLDFACEKFKVVGPSIAF